MAQAENFGFYQKWAIYLEEITKRIPPYLCSFFLHSIRSVFRNRIIAARDEASAKPESAIRGQPMGMMSWMPRKRNKNEASDNPKMGRNWVRNFRKAEKYKAVEDISPPRSTRGMVIFVAQTPEAVKC